MQTPQFPKNLERWLFCTLAVLLTLLAQPNPTRATTWVGGASGAPNDWNTANNWDTASVPNSTSTAVTFGSTDVGVVNLSASVSAQSLTFNNPTAAAYTLTSSGPSGDQSLSGVSSITLAAGNFGFVSINLANISTGSLLFPFGSNLTISNNTIPVSNSNGPVDSLGFTSTVIGTPGGGGVIFTGIGNTTFFGSFAPSTFPNNQVQGGLTKSGPGFLDYAGDGTNLSGGLTLNGGTLELDYQASTASKGSGALTLAGGVLFIEPKSSATFTQTITAGTTVNAGHTDLQSDLGKLATVTLAAGPIVRNLGGTLDANPNSGVFAITTTTGNTNGLLGSGPAYATVNGGSTWAMADGSGNLASVSAFGTNVYSSGTNTDVTVNTTESAAITTNSLRFNVAGRPLLTLTGTNTIQSGGILVTPSATDGARINGGTLTAAGGGEMLFHVYGPILEIFSSVASSTGLTKTGSGVLLLGTASPGLTGPININRGDLEVWTQTAVNSASQINFNDNRDGTSQQFIIDLEANGTIIQPIRVSDVGSGSLGDDYGTQFTTGSSSQATVTLSGVISSGPGLTAPIRFNTVSDNTSGYNLTNASNTFTGNISLTHGSLGITADGSLGNAANTLYLEVNDTVHGGLVFLGSGISVAHPIIINNPTRIVSNGTDSNTISGPISGASGLLKDGTGTLVLTGATTLAGGATVNAGTLAVGKSGAVLPVGGSVTVNSGATFNWGNGAGIDNSGSAIGTLTLNNGTYRLSGGFGNFYLNQLVVGATGGTVDFTGSTVTFTHFTGSGAGITVNGNSTWTGAGTSHIENDTGALLPITISISHTVTSSVTMVGTGTAGYRLLGVQGTFFLNNPTSANSADFRVESANLQVADMTNLGSGAITLAGSVISAGAVDTFARLKYSGATASSAKPLTLDASGGDIWVSNTGTSLTLTGIIGETGGAGGTKCPLTVYGDNASGSTLVLTAANTYTGPTAVNQGGVLSIPSIANGAVASPLGASTNSAANIQLGGGFFGGDGTLRYTGPTASTDRGVTLASATYNSTIDVFTAGTMSTMSGQFTGPGALTKAGAGTLILTNTTNNYSNGTIVNAGTLAIATSGAVLPGGKNVTVNNGATFNYGNGLTINNSVSAIGTLTLNHGTYRLNNGFGDFHLNQLVIGATGGTVDFTGSTVAYTHFTGSGAGVTINGDSTWTGASSSHIENDTGAPLPITINGSSTVTSSVTMVGTGTAGFRLLGGSGTFFLNNPTSANTADFRVEAASLQVANMSDLGSGAITLAGAVISSPNADTSARLKYTGPTASSAKALTLDVSGGDIWVSSTGTTLTLTGIISETGTGRALTVYGDLASGSTLVLTAANTYTGPTAVTFGGILSIPTIANGGVASPLGKSSNASGNLLIGGGAFGGNGTLRYTGPTASTDRGATLASANYNSTIDVSTAATTLTMSGQLTGPAALTKAGAGTLVLTNTGNNFSGGVIVNAGTLSLGTSGSLALFSNITVNSGATFTPGTTPNFTFSSTLALNGGTFSVSSGANTFFANQIVTNVSGGSLNYTGAGAATLQLGNPGAAITINGNSTWLSPADAANIQANFSIANVPVTIAPGMTLTNGIALTTSSSFGFQVTGGGTLFQNSDATNLLHISAPITVTQGVFRVTDASSNSGVGNFGTGAFTLDGGTFSYGGTTASTSKGISITSNGGTIQIETPAATLTDTAAITGPGGLTKTGPGTLILGSSSNTFRKLTINAGTVMTTGFTLPTPASGANVTINPGGIYALANAATPHAAALSVSKNYFSLAGGQLNFGNNDVIITGAANQLTFNAAILPPTPAPLGTGGSTIYITTGLETGAVYIALTGKSQFDGVTFGLTDLLLRYSTAGDVTYSGHITIDDYLALDRGFLSQANGYANGDFNHDGIINAADYALIDNNYRNEGNATLAAEMIAQHFAEFGVAYTSAFDTLAGQQPVPEPASLAMLSLGVISVLVRRRRVMQHPTKNALATCFSPWRFVANGTVISDTAACLREYAVAKTPRIVVPTNSAVEYIRVSTFCDVPGNAPRSPLRRFQSERCTI